MDISKMHPLLDKEKQKQAKQYEKENRLLGLAEMILSLVLLLSFYYSGMSGWLVKLEIGQSIIWKFLIYVALFFSTLTILGLPLSFYSGYIHEHRWHFSNQTVKSWLWEKLKSFLVGLIIISLVLGLLFWIMSLFPKKWWLIAGLAMALVGVVFATLFPVVILPIFNKYVPIENEKLTDSLKKILSIGGLKSSGFFKEDMSRQTKKENAFLAGLGETRRVVLGDNLMDNMTIPEIESIIAHEVGHFKKKHIWKNIVIGTLQQLMVFYLLDLTMKSIFPQFLSSTTWNLTFFPVFAVMMGFISLLLFGPLNNALSSYFEKQADLYSLKSIENKRAFMTAMAGLADRNLSNAYPVWWVRLLYYSHPPIGERLQLAEEYTQ